MEIHFCTINVRCCRGISGHVTYLHFVRKTKYCGMLVKFLNKCEIQENTGPRHFNTGMCIAAYYKLRRSKFCMFVCVC